MIGKFRRETWIQKKNENLRRNVMDIRGRRSVWNFYRAAVVNFLINETR